MEVVVDQELVTPPDQTKINQNGASTLASSRVSKARRNILKRTSLTSPEHISTCKKPMMEPKDPRLFNKYSCDSRSPFIIYMEKTSKDKSNPITSANESSVRPLAQVDEADVENSKKVKNNRYSKSGQIGVIAFGKRIIKYINIFKDAFDLRVAGRNKFSVCFREGHIANKFVDVFNRDSGTIFPSEGWLAFVPGYKVIRQYIVKGIDDDDSPEEVLANIRPPPEWGVIWTPPFQIRRLRRRVHSNDETADPIFVDTNTYVVSFRSFSIPNNLIYMGKRIFLEPFIQKVRRCQTCHRFGHIAKFCRSANNGICGRCSEKLVSHDDEQCKKCTPKCINCIRNKLANVEHEATSINCPVFIKQKKIKKIMASHCISPAEAELMLEEGGDNPPGGWSRPPLGVPLPTFRDYIPSGYASIAKMNLNANADSKNNTINGNSNIPRFNYVTKTFSDYGTSFPTISKITGPSYPVSIPSPSISVSYSQPRTQFSRSGNRKKKRTQDLDSNNNNRKFTSDSSSKQSKLYKENTFNEVNVEHNNKVFNMSHPQSYSQNRQLKQVYSSSLNPSMDVLDLWIADCHKKFTPSKAIQREILIQMGQNLLQNAMCT